MRGSPPAVVSVPVVSPTAVWPLVGRADELAQVLDSLTSAGGAVLAGPAGVGKSRLAAEALDAIARDGWSTFSVTAGSETVAAPFTPFAPFLGDDHGGDHVARFLRAGAAMTSAGDRVALWIDDAQLLDDVSLAFVRHLLTATPVRVVATVRTESPLPSTVARLWQDGGLRRIELHPLSQELTERLLRVVLHGDVHRSVLDWIWQTTRGNPLFVHELLLDAIDRGALAPRDGRWAVDAGVGGAGTRLQEVVAARVGAVSVDEREAVELLALAQPLGLTTLEGAVGAEVVARLEDRGLVIVRADRRRKLVSLAHPIHGEVVRATMSVTAGRDRRRRLIALTTGVGGRRQPDAVRVALWRYEVGDTDDWRSLLAAAEELAGATDRTILSALHGAAVPDISPARGLLEQAVLLAGSAFESGRSVRAAALLVRLLTRLGRDAEVPDVHARAAGLAIDEADELLLVKMRAVDVFFDHGDAPSAHTMLQAFTDRATDPDVHVAASASLAMVTALSGAPDDALAIARTVIDADAGARGDRLLGIAAAAIGLGEAGRITEALATLDEAFRALVAGDPGDLVVSISLVRTLLLACAGRMDEADQVVGSCYEAAVRADDGTTMGVFAALAAHLALERGHAERATALAGEATVRLADVDAYGLHDIALALRVHAAALSGELDVAAAARQQLDAEDDRKSGSESQRARGWLDVASGRTSTGVARLQVAAEVQDRAGRVMRAVAALHDLVRLGHAGVAVSRLQELATGSDSAVVDAMAAQAQAVVGSDGDALACVGAAWSAMGYDLFAAEAFAEAARVFGRAGKSRLATNARVRSDEAARRCGRVQTPALLADGPVAGLTRREREITGLAARGLTDRQIADELVVSIRTVQSHLYNAYAKLGAEGRSDLAALLG